MVVRKQGHKNNARIQRARKDITMYTTCSYAARTQKWVRYFSVCTLCFQQMSITVRLTWMHLPACHTPAGNYVQQNTTPLSTLKWPKYTHCCHILLDLQDGKVKGKFHIKMFFFVKFEQKYFHNEQTQMHMMYTTKCDTYYLENGKRTHNLWKSSHFRFHTKIFWQRKMWVRVTFIAQSHTKFFHSISSTLKWKERNSVTKSRRKNYRTFWCLVPEKKTEEQRLQQSAVEHADPTNMLWAWIVQEASHTYKYMHASSGILFREARGGIGLPLKDVPTPSPLKSSNR